MTSSAICHHRFPLSLLPHLASHWATGSEVLLCCLLFAGGEGCPFRVSSISELQKPVLKIVGSIGWPNIFDETPFVLNQGGLRSRNTWVNLRLTQSQVSSFANF